MSGYAFALTSCVLLVLALLLLLRRRRLREKYVAIWLVLAVGVCVLGAFPSLVSAIATAVGVETPSNLLFALALMVLLIVCVQLSTELTSLEEKSRTLVEEVALLRHDVDGMQQRTDRQAHTEGIDDVD